MKHQFFFCGWRGGQSLLEDQGVEGEGISKPPQEERLTVGLELQQLLCLLELRLQAGGCLQVGVQRR